MSFVESRCMRPVDSPPLFHGCAAGVVLASLVKHPGMQVLVTASSKAKLDFCEVLCQTLSTPASMLRLKAASLPVHSASD